MSQMRQVRAVISGRVQGVSYRAWTVKTAQELGLGGWVRNRRDGTVEVVFMGDANNVDVMIEKCHAGPLLAQVASVKVVTQDNPVEPPVGSEFEQLPTA